MDGHAACMRIDGLEPGNLCGSIVVDHAGDPFVTAGFRHEAIHSVFTVKGSPFFQGVRTVFPAASVGKSKFLPGDAAVESGFAGIGKSPLDDRCDYAEAEISDFYGTGVCF